MVTLISRFVNKDEKYLGYMVEDATGYRFFVDKDKLKGMVVLNEGAELPITVIDE